MCKQFKNWETDFIYLAFPLEKTSDIAKHLNRNKGVVANIGRRFKLKKYYNLFKAGIKFQNFELVEKTNNRLENQHCWKCKCECGKIITVQIRHLIYCYNLECKCKPELDTLDIINMYSNLKTLKQIKEKYKITPKKIVKILKINNVEIRNEEYYKKRGLGLRSTGYKNITGTFWGHYVRGARSRNLDFKIDKTYAWSIFLSQKGICALTGEKLFFDNDVGNRNGGNASIDRIDSSKGYIEGNIQWVCKKINIMKMQLNNEQFVNLCGKVHNYMKDKNGILQI